MKEKKKSTSSSGILYKLVIFCLLCLIAFCLYKILPYYLNNHKSISEYKDLSSSYVKVDDDTEDHENSESADSTPFWAKTSVDLASLQKLNPDIKGWIRFDNTDVIPIDYPIVYDGSNDTYLHADIYKKYSYAGTLFIEENNKGDFSDLSTIIYGHNMNNGSMFGSLKKYYRDSSTYDDNQYFTIYTADKAYRYQIFSYFSTTTESFVYQTGFSQGEEYKSYLSSLLSSSSKKTGITPPDDAKIVLLSTCQGRDSNTRFIVCGLLIDEY